ncbi:MAG: PaaX family transcriptional regulator C-terminal domain-containing protein [Pseudonocardiaceae bacterium]
MSDFAQARGAGLVFFTLGAAQVPPQPPLPGPVLVRLLADLGLGEGAARSTILRLRRSGSITSVRVGHTAGYAPSPSTLTGHRRHAAPPAAAGQGWNGAFHTMLVHVPERRRSFRDAFRRAATVAGYRSLRPGLLIAPSDRRTEIAPVLDRAPKDASVLFAQLRLSTEDSKTVAAQLWALEELGHRYRALAHAARDATQAARRSPPAGPVALRALAAATLPIYEAIRDDPDLPPQLLVPDWPQAELRTALREALHCLAPNVSSYIEQLRADTRPLRHAR